eukprot:ANDGO_04579.mRNA.1 hypothetical protein
MSNAYTAYSAQPQPVYNSYTAAPNPYGAPVHQPAYAPTTTTQVNSPPVVRQKPYRRSGTCPAITSIVLFFVMLVLLGVAVSTKTVWWKFKSSNFINYTFTLYPTNAELCYADSCDTRDYDDSSWTDPSAANSWFKQQKGIAGAAFAFALMSFLLQLISHIFFFQRSNKLAVQVGYVYLLFLFLTFVLTIASTFRYSGNISRVVCDDLRDLGSTITSLCSNHYFAADETITYMGGVQIHNTWGPEAGWKCSLTAFIFGIIVLPFALVTIIRFAKTRRLEGDNPRAPGSGYNNMPAGADMYNAPPLHAQPAAYAYNPPVAQQSYYPPPPASSNQYSSI